MAKKKSSPERRDPRPAVTATPPAAAHGGQFIMFRETIESIVVAFVLAFLFRTFEAEAFVIPTGSMSPSLQGQHKDVNCPECAYAFRTTASSEGEDRDKLRAELNQLGAMIKEADRQLAAAIGSFPPGSDQVRRRQGQRDAMVSQYDNLKQQIEDADVVGGMCPMCRYLMPMRPDLPANVRDQVDVLESEIETQTSYPGDRILVNKYGLDFSEPERWDVIVFKFPGDGNMNYIKRLVGLPGEMIRIYQGDVFTRPPSGGDDDFQIERKPPDKVAAMLEVVHDTDFEPTTLYNAGWPLRWDATTRDGWKVEAKAGEQTVQQRFTVDLAAEAPEAHLRYRHQVPEEQDWAAAREIARAGSLAEAARAEGLTEEEARNQWQARIHPQLITDFNAYNARLLRGYARHHGWKIVPNSGPNSGNLGTEWVGDLGVECDVDVAEARGELTLDVVEAGNHFRATIDLKSGMATLGVIDGRTGEARDFKATGQTPLSSPGQYRLRFANVDDQLLLWVDDELVDCGDATYNPDKLLGGRASMIPWASDDDGGDQGDLAPVGAAARGAKLAVTRLAVLRDIYYIATKHPGDSQHVWDYQPPMLDFTLDGKLYPQLADAQQLFLDSAAWPRFATRQKREFEVEENQLFVMGDNSPESKDCRLWREGNERTGIPGGSYLDRRLLIGKAIYVFWPHSWGGVPGLRKLPGWPNFRDMRLVR